jgi:uncharacterized protein YaaQ
LKLIVAIVQDNDSTRLVRALVKNSFYATKLASTGGFLREGNTTLLLGVEDDKVDDVLNLISEVCKPREQMITPLTPGPGPVDSFFPSSVRVQVGGATIFVVPVEKSIKM